MNSYNLPAHVEWKFDNILFSEIRNSGEKFEFSYIFDRNIEYNKDLRLEIQNAIKKLSQNFKLSICISGADSEIIAREAAFLGLPFEIYFLDIWNLNSASRNKAILLGKELNRYVNIITLTKEEAFDSVIPNNYKILQAEKPTYLCIPFLLDRIPKDTLIIGGEGDPQKSGPDYIELLANKPEDYIPISITEVFYRQWAILNNRNCEMYFYSSTPELLMSYFYHPLLHKTSTGIYTRTLVDSIWPNLNFGYKTTNWEDDTNSNLEIRKFVRSLNLGYNRLPATCITQV